MIIINKEKMNILKPDVGKLLKEKRDNGKTLEDGTYILFVDSSDIEGTVLNNITYLNY